MINFSFRNILIALVATITMLFSAFVALDDADAAISVRGYYRSNGTYVQPHYRSNPDGNPYNNWSYPGNTNPYTGETAGGNPSTYLENYYSNSSDYSTDYGSGSSYSSVFGGYYYGSTLFCNSGYYKKISSCVKAPENSYAIGESFFCNYGYFKNGDACKKVPDNSYSIGSSWYCNSGYQKQGEICVTPQNGNLIGSYLYCNYGYVNHGGVCISHTENCQLSFGTNVTGGHGTNGGSSCTCLNGYEWNTLGTACQEQINVQANITANIYSGNTVDQLQTQIQSLLKTIASLQAQLAALRN